MLKSQNNKKLANYVITSIHVKKYNDRHERDREIINESIETFTGFIDAKDPYTNRVYRNRRTKEFILQEIETNKGKQFDPKIADVAMRLIKENLLEE
ncbi:MAG: hypothetical protein K6F51_07325 [Acetatifactor sp.]|nr:hypothetical protein [Acetatifactor sp.]